MTSLGKIIIPKIVTFILFHTFVSGHLFGDKLNVSELKKICDHAYKCIHDNVMVCGKSVNEARTFLDLCDMYEYSCEYSMVFRHVKEDEHCPNPKAFGGIIGK